MNGSAAHKQTGANVYRANKPAAEVLISRLLENKMDNARKKSQREKEHEKMLKEALARPGVREMMKVYEDWRKKDQLLDTYRAATKTHRATTATNHTNVVKSA